MLKRHNPKSVWSVPEPFKKIYSHAAEISEPKRVLLVSGQIGVEPDGNTLAGFEDQCRQAMRNVEALLNEADMSVTDVLRITYYLTNAEHLAALSDVRTAVCGSTEPPAVTTLVVAALARPELLVEIEVTAAQ